jgi:hypothetical protein
MGGVARFRVAVPKAAGTADAWRRKSVAREGNWVKY